MTIPGFPIWSRARYHRFAPAFTMVEIVVMLSILVFISAILLSTFPGFNEGALLMRTQQELALNLRRAQNMTLAVARVEYTDPGDGLLKQVVPNRVGLHFDKLASPSSYFIFADIDDNGQYDAATDGKIGKDVMFQRGLKFADIQVQSGSTWSSVTSLDIVFSAPEANIAFNPTPVISNLGTAQIAVVTPNLQLSRLVLIRKTGQISLQ